MLLTTLLNTIPLTKFVLIQDSLQEKGRPILNYLIKTHKQRNLKINYFVFEGVFNTTKKVYYDTSVVLHDFTNETKTIESFTKQLRDASREGIIVIDSLSNALIYYGFSSVYKVLYEICSSTDSKQLIAILHEDVLEETTKTIQCLEHLSTCSLKLLPKSELYNRRISYVYKKIGGKIVKECEEFRFENDNLITEPLRKLDVKQLIQENVAPLPENLTTFKISLEDKEKESRDKLVLPYLPQKSGESKIFYEFDHVDDWDEEDPDDDLDI